MSEREPRAALKEVLEVRADILVVVVVRICGWLVIVVDDRRWIR